MQDNIRRFPQPKTGESSADLLRECGERLTDRTLWNKFQERFQGRIFLYLLRTLHLRGIHEDVADVIPDLAQEVYLRLVQHDGKNLKTFRGTTEFSVKAFLARISATVVLDHLRAAATEKRHVQVVSLDRAREAESTDAVSESTEFDSSQLSSILSWIDIERIVDGDPDRKNARRNALIFKLHYIDGFEAGEIAGFAGFELTKSGVETVLARLRKRIQQ